MTSVAWSLLVVACAASDWTPALVELIQRETVVRGAIHEVGLEVQRRGCVVPGGRVEIRMAEVIMGDVEVELNCSSARATPSGSLRLSRSDARTHSAWKKLAAPTGSEELERHARRLSAAELLERLRPSGEGWARTARIRTR